MPTLDQLIQQFKKIHLNTGSSDEVASLVVLIIHPLTADRVKIVQEKDPAMTELMEKAN